MYTPRRTTVTETRVISIEERAFISYRKATRALSLESHLVLKIGLSVCAIFKDSVSMPLTNINIIIV